MSVINIQNISAFKKLSADNPNKIIVVDLSAKWCGPCKRIAPAYHKFATESKTTMSNIIFCKTDIDDCEGLVKLFSVSMVPTFGFAKNGKMINKVGGANLNEVMQMCKKYAN